MLVVYYSILTVVVINKKYNNKRTKTEKQNSYKFSNSKLLKFSSSVQNKKY